MRSSPDAIDAFIIDYLIQYGTTDATDQAFHEEFYQRFGGARQETFYGAQMVHKAQRHLKRLCDEGVLYRARVAIGEAPASGYPNWVYVYSLMEATE